MFLAMGTQKDLLLTGMNGAQLRSEAEGLHHMDRDELSISADKSSHWGLAVRDLAQILPFWVGITMWRWRSWASSQADIGSYAGPNISYAYDCRLFLP